MIKIVALYLAFAVFKRFRRLNNFWYSVAPKYYYFIAAIFGGALDLMQKLQKYWLK